MEEKVIKKILIKYKSMSEPVKASLFFTICSFVQKGIALLTTPIFTRLLSTSEYGDYTIYQSWYSIAIIFCTLHVEHGAFNAGVLKFEEQKEKFISSLMGLTTTLTISFFLSVFLLKTVFGVFKDVSYFMVIAMALQILFVPSFSIWSANERFNFKYKKVVTVTLLYAILNPILGIMLIYCMGTGAKARILGMVISQILIGGYFYIYFFNKSKCLFNKTFWRFSILFCLPLIPHYLSETMLQQADRLMIASYIGKSEAAIYSVAYTISMMVVYISNAINQSFMPYLYKSIKMENTEKICDVQKALLLIVLAVCIVAMAFAPELLIIFASKEYSVAVDAIPSIVISTFFIFAYNHYCYVEMYYEKNIFIMIASILAALLNIILNSIFIPTFGFVAAGYTTLFSYLMFCVMHFIMYKKIIKENKIKDFYSSRFFLALSIIAIIATICMQLIYRFIIVRYTIIILIICVMFIYRNKIIKYIQIKQ